MVPIATGCCSVSQWNLSLYGNWLYKSQSDRVCGSCTSCFLHWNDQPLLPLSTNTLRLCVYPGDICHQAGPPGYSCESSKYWCWHFMHFRTSWEEWFKRALTRTSRAAVFFFFSYVEIKSGLICISSERQMETEGMSLSWPTVSWSGIQLCAESHEAVPLKKKKEREKERENGPLQIHPVQTEQGGGQRRREKGGRGGRTKKDRQGQEEPGVGPCHIHAAVLHMLSPPECFPHRPSLSTGKVPWWTKKTLSCL